MSNRKLEALRNLAERPGTEAEGCVAREMLRRHEAKRTPTQVLYGQFGKFLRTGNIDDLSEAVGASLCACGRQHRAFKKCDNVEFHEKISTERYTRFGRAMRIYYNCWAYPENCPGVVVGYSKDWGWMRIKFDHLKTVRSVPVYTAKGWHLSTEPLDQATIRDMGLCG